MTRIEIKMCFDNLLLPPDKTREWNWFKQIHDLSLDMCLKIHDANYGTPTQSDAQSAIIDCIEDVHELKQTYLNKKWGWKALLHKTWQDFLSDGKKQGVHPEYDVSTKNWVWIDDKQAERLIPLLQDIF